jgi:hypothetical protein
MATVMTIIEADVPGEFWPELQSAWSEISRSKPPQIVHSWLVQGLDGRDTWCVVTIWQSSEAFQEYRSSTDVPAPVKMFRAVEAEPVLATFEVVAEE